eukprot:scaffold763_cov402-Prasinococcus_capsulatus_cf.AAC.5
MSSNVAAAEAARRTMPKSVGNCFAALRLSTHFQSRALSTSRLSAPSPEWLVHQSDAASSGQADATSQTEAARSCSCSC